jgi:hypothetical protein
VTEAFPKTKLPRRMWMYFRLGHGQYLLYATAFSNFILIFYRLAIEQVPYLQAIIPSLTLFALIFLPTYIALAVIVGRWHVKSQLMNDQVVSAHYNPPIKKILENQDAIMKRLNDIEKKVKK